MCERESVCERAVMSVCVEGGGKDSVCLCG